jgi:hypothetical protein
LLLVAFSLMTFAAFMLFDPHPNLLLACCTSMNVAIIVWALYRLYQWDILLSPVSTMFAGPAMFSYYSLGNLGARIAGEGRFIGHYGALEYYPAVALLSTIGLFLYCIIVFGVFQQQMRSVRLRFQDFSWQPFHAYCAIIVGVSVVTYLSLKYPFVSGYFSNVIGAVDRSLAASATFFVMLIAIIGASLTSKGLDRRARSIGIVSILVAMVLAVGMRSRTFMLLTLITIMLCMITLRPQLTRRLLIVIAGIGIVVFSYGTVVKGANAGGGTSSIVDNLLAIGAADSTSLLSTTRNGINIDYQYRTAGFEFPAAILQCLELGVEPMYGEGIAGGFLQGLPSFIRPAGSYSERGAIGQHFLGRCLNYDDSIGIPLAGGLADWGLVLGIGIYAAAGLITVLMWRIVQLSPYLFIGYLMVPFFPDNFLWDMTFYAVRAIGFAALVLFIFKPLLMPSWHCEIAEDSEPISTQLEALAKGKP